MVRNAPVTPFDRTHCPLADKYGMDPWKKAKLGTMDSAKDVDQRVQRVVSSQSRQGVEGLPTNTWLGCKRSRYRSLGVKGSTEEVARKCRCFLTVSDRVWCHVSMIPPSGTEQLLKPTLRLLLEKASRAQRPQQSTNEGSIRTTGAVRYSSVSKLKWDLQVTRRKSSACFNF